MKRNKEYLVAAAVVLCITAASILVYANQRGVGMDIPFIDGSDGWNFKYEKWWGWQEIPLTKIEGALINICVRDYKNNMSKDIYEYYDPKFKIEFSKLLRSPDDQFLLFCFKEMPEIVRTDSTTYYYVYSRNEEGFVDKFAVTMQSIW